MIPTTQNSSASVDKFADQPEETVLPLPEDTRSKEAPCATNNPEQNPQPFKATLSDKQYIMPTTTWGKPSGSAESVNHRSPADSPLDQTESERKALASLSYVFFKRKGLHTLWPQVIVASSLTAKFVIARVLHRLGEDLERLSASRKESKKGWPCALWSSQFIMGHAVTIAAAICEAYQARDGLLPPSTNTEDDIILTIKSWPGAHPSSFLFSSAKDFIFETEPILSLEANIRKFLRNKYQPRFSKFTTYLRSCMSTCTQLLCRTHIPTGKRRVKWRCICGCLIIDDYDCAEEEPVTRFEYLLKEYNRETKYSQNDLIMEYSREKESSKKTTEYNQETKYSSNELIKWYNMETKHSQNNPVNGFNQATTPIQGGHDTSSFKAVTRRFQEWVMWLRNTLTDGSSHGLPSHQQDTSNPSARLGACAISPGAIQTEHNFLLLCVPYLRWGLQLQNTEVCMIHSDLQFFKLLRWCYFSQRPEITRGMLRRFAKVRALRFVKFEVFRNKLVDVRACPSMPVESSDYTYDPTPPDTIPPIGPNLLMHLFENPDHADVTSLLFNRVPKKLRTQLEACSVKGSSIGWGVEFVEGVDWYSVFVSGCLGFLFCLTFAVAWSAARGDVQGGFGIASFLLTFFVFCGGMLHYLI
ncbi:putative transcription factor C2H2 [Rosellinia necatrix]|uniref:Putative transcription factor C2H2 n=1 Tax=Rosellinia necatrix TaxID=77044 RepID=A0A1S8ABH5_ROSNE|nr:putative transcription factor C2H2 [Rosellinia necatrix]